MAKYRILFLAKRRECVFTNRWESDRHDHNYEGYSMRKTLFLIFFSPFYQLSCYMRNKKKEKYHLTLTSIHFSSSSAFCILMLVFDIRKERNLAQLECKILMHSLKKDRPCLRNSKYCEDKGISGGEVPS